jgi:hypothetical protein
MCCAGADMLDTDQARVLRDVAARLSGQPVRALAAAHMGANSRIFRIETDTGPLALKAYPVRQGDSRRRAEVEWKALRFLRARCGDTVPRPVARDDEGRFLLMEWFEGAAVRDCRPADIDAAADFVVRVFAQSKDPEASEFPPASEACLSAGAIVDQIRQRLVLLCEGAVDRFLEHEFLPALDAATRGWDPASKQDLAPGLRRLIPSDFGFHNALRQPDGALRYIDFDYFGWDDPVKLAADFVLHPAMQLSRDDKHAFVGRIASALADDPEFSARLKSRLPLFALRWIMILFNPFRRDRIGEQSVDEAARRALIGDRLGKARTLLAARV